MYTPETLRKAAAEMVRLTYNQYEGFAFSPYKIDAHADAWEKDMRIKDHQIERNQRLTLAQNALYEELGVVRKRLEETKKELGAWKVAMRQLTKGDRRLVMLDISEQLAKDEK